MASKKPLTRTVIQVLKGNGNVHVAQSQTNATSQNKKGSSEAVALS